MFDVLGVIYIMINITDHEKCRFLWKRFVKQSIEDNTSVLTMLMSFQLQVVFQYGIHAFGERIINHPNVFEVLHGLTLEDDIVKELLDFKDIKINKALKNIELCFILLRKCQDTKNKKLMNDYLDNTTKPFVLLTN